MESSPTIKNHSHNGQTIRLLLIDEKTYLTHLDKQSFRDKGAVVYSADNQASAEKYLSSKQIDVVSCNVDFKDGAGMRIFKNLISKHSPTAYLWVVTTYNASTETDQKATDIGADLVVRLPVSKEYFMKKMRLALGGATRKDERISTRGVATFCYQGEYIKASIHELSISGLLVDNISAVRDILSGDVIPVILHLDGLSRPINVDTVFIRESGCKKFIALEIKNISEGEKRYLKSYITRTKSTLRLLLEKSG